MLVRNGLRPPPPGAATRHTARPHHAAVFATRISSSSVWPPHAWRGGPRAIKDPQTVTSVDLGGPNGASSSSSNGANGGSGSGGGGATHGGASASSSRSHSQQQQQRAPSSAAVDTDVLVEFRDVYKSFGDKRILNGASFKIRRGEAVGIIGASGTGKSTTLRLAAGLLAPDRGEILVNGTPRVGLLSDQGAAGEQLRFGMVFQNAALFDSLTVGENVGFMLYEHSALPASEIRRRVAASLAQVGLKGVEDLYPSELSGGMRKRVALARAVVTDAGGCPGGAGHGLKHTDPRHPSRVEQLLMYDEPTAGLDPVASTVVEDLIRSLQAPPAAAASQDDGEGSGGGGGGGISSYIVVTHQHSTIRRAVDRIIFLHQGRVVWTGTTAEFDTTDEPIVRQFAEGSLEGPISYV